MCTASRCSYATATAKSISDWAQRIGKRPMRAPSSRARVAARAQHEAKLRLDGGKMAIERVHLMSKPPVGAARRRPAACGECEPHAETVWTRSQSATTFGACRGVAATVRHGTLNRVLEKAGRRWSWDEAAGLSDANDSTFSLYGVLARLRRAGLCKRAEKRTRANRASNEAENREIVRFVHLCCV